MQVESVQIFIWLHDFMVISALRKAQYMGNTVESSCTVAQDTQMFQGPKEPAYHNVPGRSSPKHI